MCVCVYLRLFFFVSLNMLEKKNNGNSYISLGNQILMGELEYIEVSVKAMRRDVSRALNSPTPLEAVAEVIICEGSLTVHNKCTLNLFGRVWLDSKSENPYANKCGANNGTQSFDWKSFRGIKSYNGIAVELTTTDGHCVNTIFLFLARTIIYHAMGSCYYYSK